ESVADRTVITFLRELPIPSKALVTTRERIYFSQPMRLVELSEPEGLDLINKEIQTRRLKLTPEQKHKLYQRTGGIPLVLTLTVARLAAGWPADSVLADLGQVHEDLVSYCLQSSIDALQSEDARRILLAASLFAVDVSSDALKSVAGFINDPVSYQNALARLQELSLIDERDEPNGRGKTSLTFTPGEPKRYILLPPTRDFAYKTLVADPELRQSMLERQINYYLELLSKLGYYYTPEHWRQLAILNKERENLFGLMTYLYEQQAWRLVIQFLAYLYGYLSFYGHWSDYLKWMERVAGAVDVLKAADEFDSETQILFGWCLSEKCWIQCKLKQPDLAKASGEQAITIFRTNEEQNGEARVLRHLGVIELELFGNTNEAKKHYYEALGIWQLLNDEYEIVSIYNNLGSVALQEKNFSEAETLLLKTLELKEKLNDIPRLGNTLYYLGQLYFSQKDLQKAKTFFHRTIKNTKMCGDILYQAQATFRLAQINIIENNVQMALDLANESLSLFQHLGMEEQCQEVIGFLNSN
ncbi:MAG: tetratricopeptide repeat protein, partial [Pseudomonadota bacterium]|nr:tetratricopeptide repeat protein [Pseudomonadota bacterium]